MSQEFLLQTLCWWKEGMGSQFKITIKQGKEISTNKVTLGMTLIFSFYVLVVPFVWLIGVVIIYFLPTDINLSPVEEKWLKEENVKNDFKMFIQTGFVPYWNQGWKRRTKLRHVLMTVFSRFLMPTSASTSGKICIVNLGLGNMLIAEYTSLSPE